MWENNVYLFTKPLTKRNNKHTAMTTGTAITTRMASTNNTQSSDKICKNDINAMNSPSDEYHFDVLNIPGLKEMKADKVQCFGNDTTCTKFCVMRIHLHHCYHQINRLHRLNVLALIHCPVLLQLLFFVPGLPICIYEPLFYLIFHNK